MKTTGRQNISQSDRWEESRKAEERGDIYGALNIHREIMSEETTSHAIMLRAGWLYYRLGLYEISLRYYGLASSVADGDWPLYGTSNYLALRRGTGALATMAESIYGAEHPTAHSAAA